MNPLCRAKRRQGRSCEIYRARGGGYPRRGRAPPQRHKCRDYAPLHDARGRLQNVIPTDVRAGIKSCQPGKGNVPVDPH